MRVPQDVRGDDVSPVEQLLAVTTAVTRYDLVLAAIPLAFVLGALAGTLVEATHLGLRVGSVGALAAVAYALFGDPPTGDGPNSGRAA